MLSQTTAKKAIALLLAMITGLALASSLPTAAQSQGEPIDLVPGGEGATSWNISNIKPGDSDTKTVTLHNAGYVNGFLNIWISDIASGEGTNPESETGDTAEPGELADYLLFNISCSLLITNLSLPTAIDNFPQSVSDPQYVQISPLYAGDTVILDWQWDFPPQAGNDAQGDNLSFTINYVLKDFQYLWGEGYGGEEGESGGNSPEPEPLLLQVDMWGSVVSGERTDEGVLLETIEAVSPDGALILLLYQGTRVLDSAGNPPGLIEVKPVTPPDAPPDKLVIGPAYDLQPSCTFDPPIKFILHYDSQALSDNVSEDDLVTAYYAQDQKEWIEMLTVIDTEADTATASLSHFSIFAILAECHAVAESPPVVEVLPFSAGVYNLSITPSQVRIWGPLPFVVRTGEEVTVTVDVVNSGSQKGEYSVILKLNGHMRATQEMTLGAKQSEQVVFILSGIEPGHHTVLVNGLSAEFNSSLWINWWLIGGIAATLVVISSFSAWLFMRRRHRTASQTSNLTP